MRMTLWSYSLYNFLHTPMCILWRIYPMQERFSHRNGSFKVIHARNNGTTGLCKPLLGNDSVNTLPRRRNHVTSQRCLAITWIVFSVQSALRSSRTVFSALSVPRLNNTSPLTAKKSPGEFLVWCRGPRVIEQEMARRLQCDLKC
jgi:hypothetical protein